jgi:small subunit ribosomal protein S9
MSKYVAAIGRRKQAVASVRLTKGTGTIVINDKPLEAYFPLQSWQDMVRSPLKLVGMDKTQDVSVRVRSGGVVAQAEGVRLGISRALVESNEELKGTLKKAGYLTRDARMKERRKYGLKKARKAPQFSKR